MYRLPFALVIIGAVLISIAIAIPFVMPGFFDSILTQKLIIKPDSEMMKNFKETPVPIYLQIWFFNITNPEDFVQGARPKLDEIGPFTYRQSRIKDDIVWNHEIGTVSFKQKKTYYFEPSRSYGPESLMITTIDPVFLSLASKSSGENVPNLFKSFSQVWFMRFSNKLYLRQTVKDLLFSGYDEPLLEELHKLTKDPVHKKGKTGFFFGKNASFGRETEIFTGELGMHNYQTIFRMDNKEVLDYWEEDRCNVISGTEGGQFPRPIDPSKDNRIYFFSGDLCRSIYFEYEKEVKFGPLKLYRYILPVSALANSEENKCYCTSNFTCQPGVIDVSPCRDGSPIVISTPHFHQGGAQLLQAVEGLHPVKEHVTFVDVEPTTGVSMRVQKRIQLNMAVRRYGNNPLLSSAPELIMPILWVNESMTMPMDRVEKLYTALAVPTIVITYGSWGLLGLGLLLILIAYILTFKTYKRIQRLQKRRQQFSDKKKTVHNNSTLLEKSKLNQSS